jgi:Fe-Mn family superoxide dismutase
MKTFSKLGSNLFKFPSKNFASTVHKVELPKLLYKYEELEPVLGRDVLETHYAKHHQTYVTNYNNALDATALALETGNHEKLISLQSAIKFNGGSHINHSIYWNNLAPVKSKFFI